LRIISEELEAPSGESDNIEDYGAETGAQTDKFARLIREPKGYLLGVTFVVGLLLGWMVIGWWLWPVRWTNSDPQHLRPEYQRTFVGLVAEDYWQTKDISRAREALAGWDDEALADLLTAMVVQASSPEARQHLEALAEALELPEAEVNLFTSLLNQKVIILGAILSASPLVVAIVLAISPLVRSEAQQREELLAQEESLLEEGLEKLLAQEEEREAEEDIVIGEEEIEEEIDGKKRKETEAEELLGEEEEIYEDEEDTDVQTMLLGFFEDEDESLTRLQAICKGLVDIDIDDLLQRSKEVAAQLERGNSLRSGSMVD